jgi:2-polyprenyl-3-methyl-5-hydroxy-6-metoxy-1,4-benzoquinol methylase
MSPRHALTELGRPAPHCVVARAEDAIFPDDSFDKVVLLNILEHVEDPPIVLSRIRPWVTDGGSLHIIVNLATSMHRRLGIKMGVIKHLEELSESDHELGHYRVYTIELLRQHVDAAGFRVTVETPFYLNPLPTS